MIRMRVEKGELPCADLRFESRPSPINSLLHGARKYWHSQGYQETELRRSEEGRNSCEVGLSKKLVEIFFFWEWVGGGGGGCSSSGYVVEAFLSSWLWCYCCRAAWNMVWIPKSSCYLYGGQCCSHWLRCTSICCTHGWMSAWVMWCGLLGGTTW